MQKAKRNWGRREPSWKDVLSEDNLPLHVALLWIAVRDSAKILDALASGKGDVKKTLRFENNDVDGLATRSWNALSTFVFNGSIRANATAFNYAVGEIEFFEGEDSTVPIRPKLLELQVEEQIVLRVTLGRTEAWLKSANVFLHRDDCWKNVRISKDDLLIIFPPGETKWSGHKRPRNHKLLAAADVIVELWPNGSWPKELARVKEVNDRLTVRGQAEVKASTIQRAFKYLDKLASADVKS